MFASYVHVTEIAPEILEADSAFKKLDSLEEVPDNERNIWVNIPVKAGQLIGKAEEWGLLGMLAVDTNVKLTGFTSPEKYKGAEWKIHAVPPKVTKLRYPGYGPDVARLKCSLEQDSRNRFRFHPCY